MKVIGAPRYSPSPFTLVKISFILSIDTFLLGYLDHPLKSVYCLLSVLEEVLATHEVLNSRPAKYLDVGSNVSVGLKQLPVLNP